MDSFQKIIENVCDELGINMRIVSKGWIILLEKDNKIKFIVGEKFDLNSHGIGLIMDDKYALFEIFKEKNIPVVQHKILYKPTIQREYAKGSNHYEIAEKYFEQNNNSIVIKPNCGLSGKDVYHVIKKDEISFYLDRIFKNNEALSLCPFYEIKAEYRLIVLDNTCLLMYGKRRPKVIGDGNKTIRKLLQEFNPNYFKNILSDSFYDKILPFEEEYEYSWKFNLAEGSIPFEIKDSKVQEKLLTLLNKITSQIYLGFCSVDIIETISHEFLIMEINSGVSLKKYSEFFENGDKISKEIYKKAIQKLFQ